MKIYGFALLRNGVKYDYPFKESLYCMGLVGDKTFLALGKGEDSTEEAIKDIPNLEIAHTTWDENLRSGGLILSVQTNLALEFLRREKSNEEGAWGFYLQADELILENEAKKIIEDITYAENHGYDAVSFRYLHFWLRYDQIAISKKWYPQEIRAIKLKTEKKIQSWGDAQSFENVTKIYHSDAHIFHYGHVREEEAYKNKKWDILNLYHGDNKVKKTRILFKQETGQKSIKYLGPHPKIMKNRMDKMGYLQPQSKAKHLVFIGSDKLLDPFFVKNIQAERIEFVPSISKLINRTDETIIICLKPKKIWDQIWSRTEVPALMKSDLSRPWQYEFYVMLRLSEKGIRVNEYWGATP